MSDKDRLDNLVYIHDKAQKRLQELSQNPETDKRQLELAQNMIDQSKTMVYIDDGLWDTEGVDQSTLNRIKEIQKIPTPQPNIDQQFKFTRAFDEVQRTDERAKEKEERVKERTESPVLEYSASKDDEKYKTIIFDQKLDSLDRRLTQITRGKILDSIDDIETMSDKDRIKTLVSVYDEATKQLKEMQQDPQVKEQQKNQYQGIINNSEKLIDLADFYWDTKSLGPETLQRLREIQTQIKERSLKAKEEVGGVIDYAAENEKLRRMEQEKIQKEIEFERKNIEKLTQRFEDFKEAQNTSPLQEWANRLAQFGDEVGKEIEKTKNIETKGSLVSLGVEIDKLWNKLPNDIVEKAIESLKRKKELTVSRRKKA